VFSASGPLLDNTQWSRRRWQGGLYASAVRWCRDNHGPVTLVGFGSRFSDYADLGFWPYSIATYPEFIADEGDLIHDALAYQQEPESEIKEDEGGGPPATPTKVPHDPNVCEEACLAEAVEQRVTTHFSCRIDVVVILSGESTSNSLKVFTELPDPMAETFRLRYRGARWTLGVFVLVTTFGRVASLSRTFGCHTRLGRRTGFTTNNLLIRKFLL